MATTKPKPKSKRPKPVITDIQPLSEPENYTGRLWCEICYRRDGKLKIEQYSGRTRHEVLTKAQARINALLGESANEK